MSDNPRIDQIDTRLTNAEHILAEHTVEIKMLSKSNKTIEENLTEQKNMVKAMHKRLDDLRDADITKDDVTHIVRNEMPELMDKALENKAGRLVFWILTTGAAIVSATILNRLF